jgi:hypothetical protein
MAETQQSGRIKLDRVLIRNSRTGTRNTPNTTKMENYTETEQKPQEFDHQM